MLLYLGNTTAGPRLAEMQSRRQTAGVRFGGRLNQTIEAKIVPAASRLTR